MKVIKILTIFIFVSLNASQFDYTLYKKGIQDDNTMLLIGGIQGDEPGGFLAASIVATDYNITKGSLWVVPNLNFKSIIERSRGTKGDMNRKFAHIDKSDPDYKAVTQIKSLITDKNVSLILNLHDGSGFYSPTFINKDRNPNKWGNTVIIDQSELIGASYPELGGVAEQTKNGINTKKLTKEHAYNVKNTQTAKGDVEMLKSLTYFAITQGKSAFANEASKNLNAEQRTYYHLLAIEEYFKLVGIEFSRPFELNVKAVKEAIEKDIHLSLFDDYFVLNLKGLRPSLNYIPLPKDELKYTSNNPLVAVIKTKNGYEVRYGNRLMTRLIPQNFSYVKKLDGIKILADKQSFILKSGETIKVKNAFEVEKIPNIRTNIIGYSAKFSDEAGEKIDKKMIDKSFSVDKAGKIYRIEFYDTSSMPDRYAGMILVEFE
ncbi:M99 family carboxypeptidase catalytic domain-containing protein [Campylobacter sp. 9BO]|uniref:M99 family carboxypeptidase catalytic domain-containing protein n=1 Tax=Campylobacter sp. 9BO TaxID=3424759 RepID=UPI003D32E5FF